MKREDAVAPVIAAMLVLAVIVTFFAVWNASVIPSMKAQAEVSHLHDVEEGMLRFSSDIDLAASSSSDMTLSERIPLGGGDVLYSATKSGGSLAIQSEGPYMEIIVNNSTYERNRTFSLSNISYRPAGNFWQDQGYVWSQGYVNVTKENVSEPLDYYTMQDVNYDLTKVLFGINVEMYDDESNCLKINIKGVDLHPAESENSSSGNGIGQLKLNSTIRNSKIPYSGISEIQINTSFSETFGPGFRQAMDDAVNTSLNNSRVLSCPNVTKTYSPGLFTLTVPNIMVDRQTTDITLSAR
jgi:hypothetical protein